MEIRDRLQTPMSVGGGIVGGSYTLENKNQDPQLNADPNVLSSGVRATILSKVSEDEEREFESIINDNT